MHEKFDSGYMAGKHVETIDFTCKFRRQRGGRGVACLGHLLGGSCCVGAGNAVNAMFFKENFALAKKHCVAHRVGDLIERGARYCQQVDVHAHKGFIDDMQARFRQQRMDIGNPAIGGILDRKHREIGRAGFDRVDGILEGPAGHGLHVRARLAAGLMAVGSGFSLEGYAIGHDETFWVVGE